MSDSVISSGASLTLSVPGSVGSSISFSGTAGTLVLETTQITTPFSITTTSVNGTISLVSDTINAEIMNFQPNDPYTFTGADAVVIENIQTLFADLDFNATDISDFGTFATSASETFNDYIISPDGAITASVGTNTTLDATLVPVLDDVINGIFNSLASVAGADLYLQFETRTNPNSNNPLIDAVLTTNTAVNPCFCAGTRILTPEGEIAVEQLVPGDEIITATGQEAQIVWVGSRHLDINRHARPETVRPVIIEPGALADGVPARRLRLSPDHALYIDGMLVPAKALLNGHSIRPDAAALSVTYYHIELAQHDVLFAEAAAVESYLDCGQRGVFENAPGPLSLHPDFMQARREAEGCAPLCLGGPGLERIRARLAARQTARPRHVVA
jgi:hypothetical protein